MSVLIDVEATLADLFNQLDCRDDSSTSLQKKRSKRDEPPLKVFKPFTQEEVENYPLDQRDVVQFLFERGELIVRGMPFYNLSEDFEYRGKLSFEQWDAELDKMRTPDGLSNLSSTLIQKNSYVSTYTNSGFIFDANRVRIQKIYSGDAATSISNEGEISAACGLELESIEALKELIKTNTPSSCHTMNELKIKCSLKDLTGLFYVRGWSASPMIQAQTLIWRKHISEKFGIDLPIYEYHFSGKLQLFNPTSQEIKTLCRRIRSTCEKTSEIFMKELC